MDEIELYYRANYDQLVKRMTWATGSPMDAEDVVQDAFEKALKYYKSKNQDFERWFSVILSNCFKTHKSKERLGGTSKPIEEHEDEIEPVYHTAIEEITRQEIRDLANSKPEKQREVLRLTFDFGYKPSEIVTLIPDVTLRQVSYHLETFRKEVKEKYT